MRAIVYTGTGLEVQTVEQPHPEAGEILLKVHNCGVCGSDLHAVQHGMLPRGSVMGHEFSGEVVVIGKDISGWRVGDRAVSMPIFSCGDCEKCKKGYIGCASTKAIGLGKMPGGFAEYIRVQPHWMLKIPDHVSYREAALTEPMAVGLHAINKANLEEGQGCLIMGAGTVGLGVLLWALEKKAIVVISEPSEGRRQLATKVAEITAIDPNVSNPAEAITSLTPKGAEVVIECVGIPGTIQKSIEYAASHGTIVVMGACMSPDTIQPLHAIVKELNIKFGFGYTRDEFTETFNAIVSGQIDVKPLITDICNLDEFPYVFKELMLPNNKGKVLLEF